MQDRERPSGIVELRAAHLMETKLPLESTGPFVLLVHINRQAIRKRSGMIDQSPSNAPTVMSRIDEQRIDLGACHS